MNAADGGVELDPRPEVAVLRAPGNVVVEHFARRIGGNGLLEMVVEGVVGELQALLGTVRPQIAVHAAMHRFAEFIGSGAPRIVPQAAPIALLLETDDLRNSSALGFRLLECPQLTEPAWARTDDCNTTSHDSLPRSNLPIITGGGVTAAGRTILI